jgi:hypothetical protein
MCKCIRHCHVSCLITAPTELQNWHSALYSMLHYINNSYSQTCVYTPTHYSVSETGLSRATSSQVAFNTCGQLRHRTKPILRHSIPKTI